MIGHRKWDGKVKLSPREAQVLECIKLGMANRAIAVKLGVTEATAKNYLEGLYNKTGVHGRTALAVWALGMGKV